MSATPSSPSASVPKAPATRPVYQQSIESKWPLAHPVIVAKIDALIQNQRMQEQNLRQFREEMARFAMESRQQVALNHSVQQWMERMAGATVMGNFVIRPMPPAPDLPMGLPVPSTVPPEQLRNELTALETNEDLRIPAYRLETAPIATPEASPQASPVHSVESISSS